LIIEEAAALPPLRPILVMDGMGVRNNSLFDSRAEMKPTGIPITRAGFTLFSLIMDIS
jgi:hypothetical protein